MLTLEQEQRTRRVSHAKGIVSNRRRSLDGIDESTRYGDFRSAPLNAQLQSMILRRLFAPVASLLVGLVPACVGNDPLTVPATSTEDGGDPFREAGPGPGADAGPGDGAGTDGACTKTTCGAACVDLTSDALHCGACDNSCGGGLCRNKECQPSSVATAVDDPVSVTVTPNAVVWLRQGAIESCPTMGSCATPKKITQEGETFPGGLTDKVSGRLVAATSSDVVWIGRNAPTSTAVQVYKCPISGCIGGLATDFYNPGSAELPGQIVAQGSNVFISFKFLGIHKCDASRVTCEAGAAPISGTGGDQIYGLAVDTERVYWTSTFGPTPGNGGGLFSCSVNGCGGSPRTLADPAWNIAWFAGTIYLDAYGKISSCLGTGCGGTPTELAPQRDTPSPIAVDGTGVYWLERGNADAAMGPANGRVLMCSLPTCAGGVRVLATGQAAPRSIAVQDGFVYWANRGTGAVGSVSKTGSIWRVKR